jgi:4-diphosphocytidyl-2-C-methyl-D-erythritol kinase
MTRSLAPAKLNLALVVGPSRPDGKHDVATVLQRLSLADTIELEPSLELSVEDFAGDTLVAAALGSLAEAAGVAPRWRARIEKAVPVAAGLGGGSSDAATALQLANEMLSEPIAADDLHELAARLGADVPFFLRQGPQVGEGDGTILTAVELPQDYWVLLVLAEGDEKPSTQAVYEAFEERGGADGFEERREQLRDSLARVHVPRDLAALPPNDLLSSLLAAELRELGAFRADVTGAGPVVYGLFEHEDEAHAARHAVSPRGETWIARPAW